MSTGAMSKQVSIEDFVSGLRKFSESAFTHTEEIAIFLENSPVSPETLERYLAWDRQHYTRNLIDKTALYELIAICWEVGQASSVHNHRDQNCWMARSEEHTSELQSPYDLVCRLLLEKKKK